MVILEACSPLEERLVISFQGCFERDADWQRPVEWSQVAAFVRGRRARVLMYTICSHGSHIGLQDVLDM